MAVSESFKEYVLDQLREPESVTVKKMFGGYGIYADGLIFGLIADVNAVLRGSRKYHRRQNFVSRLGLKGSPGVGLGPC